MLPTLRRLKVQAPLLAGYLWQHLLALFWSPQPEKRSRPFTPSVVYGLLYQPPYGCGVIPSSPLLELKQELKPVTAHSTLQRVAWLHPLEERLSADAQTHLTPFVGGSWLQEGLGFTGFRVQPPLHAYAEKLVTKVTSHLIQSLRRGVSWVLPPHTRTPTPTFKGSSETAVTLLDFMFFFPRSKGSKLGLKGLQPPLEARMGAVSSPNISTFRGVGGLWASRVVTSSNPPLPSLATTLPYSAQFGRVERRGQLPFLLAPRSLRPLAFRRLSRGREWCQPRQVGGYQRSFFFVGPSTRTLRAWTPVRLSSLFTGSQSRPSPSHPRYLANETLKIEAAALMEQLRTTRLDFDFRALTSRFRQPSVRYRPGFFTYWRLYRHELQQKVQPWGGFRQHTLTSFVAKTRRLSSFSGFRLFQLSVWRLLSYSNLFVFGAKGAASISSVKRGGLFLNGLPVLNPHTQAYVGDILTVVHLDSATQPSSCMVSGFTHRNGSAGVGVGGWLHSLRSLDTPACLEADELSLSVTLLFEPLSWLGQASQRLGSFEGSPVSGFSTYKLYNWKYAT